MPSPPHGDHAPHAGHGSELSETQVRVRALESVLIEKGYVDPAALDVLIETYETRIGPHIGAGVVARAWTDPEFARRLFEDTPAALASLGIAGGQGENMGAHGGAARARRVQLAGVERGAG